VRLRREGRIVEVPAQRLVPGDVVLLEAGSAIPADARLVESVNLRVQEAALTGESEPVEKHTAPLPQADVTLAERRNMVYMGTAATYGRGVAVVTATGMDTELGHIAALIQEVAPEETPLQQQLDAVGKTLALFGLAVAALVLVIGVLRGEGLDEMFLTAVSVAVAVVPEGLPAVVTITLALGGQRMLRRRALIRKLPAVETLGSVTVICSDKTGTLTENRMTVTIIDVAGHYLELAGTGQHPAPSLPAASEEPRLLDGQPPTVGLVMVAGALCNDASLQPDPQSGRYLAMGDPTEGALLVAARQAGLRPDALRRHLPRQVELPFDSERKRMTTVHRLPQPEKEEQQGPAFLDLLQQLGAPYVAFTKGAVDGLLDLTSSVWEDGRTVALDESWRERIQLANDQMAQNGAGMRPIMITGDHPLTARFIAHELGIADDGRVKTGRDLENMTPEALEELVGHVSVYARVTPEHKLRIVEALQRQGHVVAMTGDGVNDSPALKRADIGIAMGITGTDVSKEAAEMVLLDDNFATIVAAVEEGRVIYDNVRRFVKFSIAGNAGKVIVMLFAPLLEIDVALLPLQLLWLNLLTDGLLGLGLGVEPPERGTMQRPPRSPKAGLLSEGLLAHVTWVGVLIGVVALLIGGVYRGLSAAPGGTWQTMIFTSLAFMQIGQALASRSSEASLFTLGLRSNMTLLAMALITLGLQLVVIYVPFLDQFFQVTPLTVVNLLVAVAAAVLVFAAIEFEKSIKRRA
jgi:Ca2+-transporting ATPase